MVPVILILMIGLSTGTLEERVIQASEVETIIRAGEAAEFDSYTIKGDLNLSGLTIEQPVHFNNTIFQDFVNFESTIFNGSTYFWWSQFNSDADFEYSEFNGEAGFMASKFNDSAYFGSSQFNDIADFGFSEFNDSAYFGSFNSDAIFMMSQFNNTAYFRGSEFNGDAVFEGTQFNGPVDSKINSFADFKDLGDFIADFAYSEFNGKAIFRDSQFNSSLDFARAQFNSKADFKGSKFNSNANFAYSEFNGKAIFARSQFNSFADFSRTQFDNTTDFSESMFRKEIKFTDAKFGGFTSFDVSQFKEGAFFENATFEDKLALTRTSYDELHIRWNSIKKGLFYDDTAYLKLIKNFKDLGYFEDYDNCYFQYRKDRRGQPWSLHPLEEPARKFLDLLSEWSYGYGTRPVNPFVGSLLLIVLFGLAWRSIGFDKNRISVEKNAIIDEYAFSYAVSPKTSNNNTNWSKFQSILFALEPFGFSAAVFLSGTRFFIDPPEIPEMPEKSKHIGKRIFNLERILGAIFTGLFLIAVSRTVIRSA